MRLQRPSALQSDINVTPLVDVCLVLLIIFMVVIPVVLNGGPVHLPRTTRGESLNSPHPIVITVKEDGVIYLDAIAIREEQLSSQLTAMHTSRADAAITVRADAAVPYGNVVHVLDTCRSAGFHDVGLASELTKHS